MQTPSIQDDEALARMLQYEEQTGGRAGAAAGLAGTPQFSYLDEQEQRDNELAHRMAQMEMQQDIPRNSSATVVGYGISTRRTATATAPTTAPTTTATTTSSSTSSSQMRPGMRSQSLDREEGMRAPGRTLSVGSADRGDALYGPNRSWNGVEVVENQIDGLGGLTSADLAYARRLQNRSFSGFERHATTNDNLGGLTSSTDLEYARRLQAEAFARLRRGDDRPGASQVIPSPEERADRELARRMQELENNGMGDFNSSMERLDAATTNAVSMSSSTSLSNRTVDDDERIARLMAATGKSLRNLQLESGDPPGMPPSVIPNPPPAQMTETSGDATTRTEPRGRPRLASTPSISTPVPTAKPSVGSIFTNRQSTSSTSTSPLPLDSQDDTTLLPTDAFLDVPSPVEKKRRNRNFLGFRSRHDKKPPPGSLKPPPMTSPVTVPASGGGGGGPLSRSDGRMAVPHGAVPLSFDSITGIPAAIPPPPGGSLSSAAASATLRPIPLPPLANPNSSSSGTSTSSVCFSCGKSNGSFVAALGKKFHPECFRCVVCHELIDVSKPFAFSKDAQGHKHPHHPKCFSQRYAATCCICRQKLPANEDGTISFVKHPFFHTEEMCPRHALEARRRCTGCHRFEPDDENFVDLDDGDRCVCFSCCRSVVIDSQDAEPMWKKVVAFFKNKLGLPIWEGMENIPIMIVGFEALNDQLQRGSNVHGGSSQIMTRGLCLTDHANCGRFRLPSMRFNQSQSSFEASNGSDRFTYYEVPASRRANSNSSVFAIMCLSGLPRDLTASVLAHEATHAWIKMHPEYDVTKPIPAQVEEGCAQLMAFLFLNDGLDAPADAVPGETGPSDAKLRQYFRFSIETEENEIYGAGYRRAAAAYRSLGIEALLMHVVRYRDFPYT